MTEAQKPPYLREMLTSQGNLYALLGSVAAGVVLSIPFGFGIGAIPLIAFAAGELIASMYVPASLTFRDKVDRKHRRQLRMATRDQLLAEIEARAKRPGAYQQMSRIYARMEDRIAALHERAKSGVNRLSPDEVERLEAASIEYLCMWLASLVMEDRAALINPDDIQERIAGLEREIREPKPGTDLRQLQKARADYLAIIERHHRMLSRKRAMEAAMLAMPDQMEEIYQTLMTLPASEDAGARLDEAMARLRLQEDIEAELAGDLAEAVPGIASPLPLRTATRKPSLAAVAGAKTLSA